MSNELIAAAVQAACKRVALQNRNRHIDPEGRGIWSEVYIRLHPYVQRKGDLLHPGGLRVIAEREANRALSRLRETKWK